MGLVSLVIAFEYTFFFVMQVIVGSSERGAGMHVFNIVFFALAMRTALSHILKNNDKRTWQIIIALAGFLCLYLLTGGLYGFNDDQYKSYLLAFGVRCVPAVFCAIVLAKKQAYFYQMQKWLQIFVILYTIGVSIAVFTAKDDVHLQERFTVGVNYQEISYCSAFAFNIGLYLVLFWKDVNKFKIFRAGFWRWINVLLLILQLYCMFSGGGRGAIANIIVVTVFLIYVKRGYKININLILGSIIFIVLVFVGVYIFYQKTGNAGAKRLVSFFIERDEFKLDQRDTLRTNALKCFWNSPLLGNGIGSIFYVMHFYSHNMFTDILAEGGIIFASIVAVMFLTIIKNIRKILTHNINNTIVYVIFFSSFTMLMFSGYYISDGGLWFSTSYLLITLSDIRRSMMETGMTRFVGGL